jgi:hypothetical protein
MLQAALIVTRTMTTTAIMDTDQIMDTHHMHPAMDTGMDRIHTGHLRVRTVPDGGGDAIPSRHV